MTADSSEISDYPDVYQTLNEGFAQDSKTSPDTPPTAASENPDLAGFIELFQDIKRDDVADIVRLVYADSLYFNDTLKTIYDGESLADYLEETAQRVDYNTVVIHQVLSDGDSYFLRWSMKTGFTVMGRKIDSRSIGMTHIRLDESGKVVFHQDFWDNTEGLFRHLPILGSLISSTRNRF